MRKTKIESRENVLVCVDESKEFVSALKYSCQAAMIGNLGLIMLYVIEDENFRHWKGVESIMEVEQNDMAKEILKKYKSLIKKEYSIKTKTLIKKGNKLDVLIEIANSKKYKIKNLILGLALDDSNSNRIITSLTGSARKKLTLPITIVPANI